MIYFMAGSRLVAAKCPSALQESSVPRFTYQTTVEGRVKAQSSPRQVMPRTWDVSASVVGSPAKSVMEDLVSGMWGDAFRFIPADAPNVNVMAPEETMLEPWAYRTIPQGGPADLGADGVAARSLIAPSSAPFTVLLPGPPETPVLPGSPVTASAWVKGAIGYVMVQFFGSDGALLYSGAVSSPTAGSDIGYRRVHVSTTAPLEARYARVSARSVLGVTQPAVTWSAQVLPFGHGRSARSVTVEAAGSQVLHSVGDRTFSEMSYTVQEVG